MKRHTKQNNQQKLGQFFTTNASELLQRYTSFVNGKTVIDPFCGGGDLLEWAKQHGATHTVGYDVEPIYSNTIIQDTLYYPPNYKNMYLVSNPPYLAQNKNKDKKVYIKWGYNDYYKCHMASLPTSCDSGILILPTNFLSESYRKTRDLFFFHYDIIMGDYYYYQIFPRVTSGILTIAFTRSNSINELSKSFPLRVHYKDKICDIDVSIKHRYGWLYGDKFFDLIEIPSICSIQKITQSMKILPNTNIIISLLDHGKYKLGAHYNEGEPIITKDSSFTTYQVSIDGVELTNKEQRDIIHLYNDTLIFYRDKYNGLFMANYMGSEQKIKSRSMSNKLLNWCVYTIKNKQFQLSNTLWK